MTSTLIQERDDPRLRSQAEMVFKLMADGFERTLGEIEYMTGYPQASISARLREFRAEGHTVARRYVRRGLHAYRLAVKPMPLSPASPDQPQ